MPGPPNNTKKKKKGRAPKHQNTFAFKHNPKSKKTEKILSSPNVGVCKRCYDKIEWRKKYRKVCSSCLLLCCIVLNCIVCIVCRLYTFPHISYNVSLSLLSSLFSTHTV